MVVGPAGVPAPVGSHAVAVEASEAQCVVFRLIGGSVPIRRVPRQTGGPGMNRRWFVSTLLRFSNKERRIVLWAFLSPTTIGV